MRPLRLLMVPVVVLASVFVAPPPARADGIPTVRFTTASTAFSPNDDGIEDVLETAVETSAAGHVRVVVETPTVRRLLLDRTVDAPATLPLTWDGRTDDGTLVPSQAYTLVATLTWDGGGRSAQLSTEVFGQPRAQLMSPRPGALLIGDMRIRWQGRQPGGVRLTMTGCRGDWQQFTSEGGSLVPSTFSLAACAPGPQVLTATSVAYAFGTSHVVQVDTIPVEVAGDGPALVLLADAEAVDNTQTLVRFDDGVVDPVRWPLRCLNADRSSFVLRIVDAAGAVVRTVLGFQTAGADCDGHDIRGPSWDGLDDQGAAVPVGRYDVEARMSDALGRVASDRAVVVVAEEAAPLQLRTPTPDTELGAESDLEWTLSAGVTVREITTRLTGCEATLPYGWTLRAPVGRSVSQHVDLRQCQPGRQRLSWSATYTDEDGDRRTFERSLVVTVRDVTPPEIIQSGRSTGGLLVGSFRPSKIGLSWWFTCADASVVTVTGAIDDEAGRRVATIPGYVPMSCPDWSGTTRHYLSWDGMDDEGHQVADGSYTIVLTATDAAGNVSRDPMPIVVDARAPFGSPVRPGAEVARQDVLTWTPRDHVQVVPWRSRVLVRGEGFETEVVGLSQNSAGHLVASGIGANCAGHSATLEVDLTWTDQFATEHSWFDQIPIRCVGERETPAELGVATRGTPRTGQTLTAIPLGLGPAQRPTYRWQRDGRDLAGATEERYLLTATDVGHDLRVRIAVGTSPVRTATSTALRVRAAALVPATPSVRGATRVGQTLTVSTPAWRPGAVTLTYQWLRDGRAVAGATRTTYKLTASDRRTTIAVRVTGRKPGYVTATRSSARTATIR